MNTEIASACQCYGLYNDKNEIIGFCGILHQPHSVKRNIKRISRLVILPDYQGIGLAIKFINVLAEIYTQQGYEFTIVTSAKNMIQALRKNAFWRMVRWSVNKTNNAKSKIDYKRKSARTECKTGGFCYVTHWQKQ